MITDTIELYLPLIQWPGPEVCGEIITDTIWMAAYNPYQLTCDVIVIPGVTLTVEAGVRVKFYHPEDDLIISGTLKAVGTQYAPIHFQPVSGTNLDSWGMVAFQTGSSGVLDHTIIEYGGLYQCIVYIASDAVQVLNSVVQYSGDAGIYIKDAPPFRGRGKGWG